MNRDMLWSRMKTAGITQSKRQDCPPDVDLKIVLQYAQVSAKWLIDFLCSLDSKTASSLARDEEKAYILSVASVGDHRRNNG